MKALTRRQSRTKKKKAARKKAEAIKKAPRIPGALYWKWRTASEALEHEHTRGQVAALHKQIITQELAIQKLHLSIAERSLKEQNKTTELALSEYNSIVGEVEAKIGRSIANTEIDPKTYAVIDSDKN